MRLRYDLGYASVDLDGFATTHHVGPSFFRDWSENGVSQIWAAYYDFDFHKDPTNYPQSPTNGGPGASCNFPGGPIATPCAQNDERTLAERRDRSGWGFLFGGEHRVRIDFNDTEIRGGYTYQHYIPDGAEFHNQVHAVWIGATTPLPLGFVLDSNVTYLYQMTRNPSSFADPDSLAPNRIYRQEGERRFDNVWRVYTAIGRAITPHVSASVEYGFTDHGSNLESFDYARHRVGGYVTVHFD
jgi:hypothetical protein